MKKCMFKYVMWLAPIVDKNQQNPTHYFSLQNPRLLCIDEKSTINIKSLKKSWPAKLFQKFLNVVKI